jgi:hypothetical protein
MYMNVSDKVYGKNGIYKKLKTINSKKFEMKNFYNSVVPLNIYLTWGITYPQNCKKM